MSSPRIDLSGRWPPLIALAVVVAGSATMLFHELEVTRFDLNDNVFHGALIHGVAEALSVGELPLDFWNPEWSLGYPVLRTYQPLAHLLVAGVYAALGGVVELETVFRWARYLLIVLWPLTVWVVARWTGFSAWTAVAAAAVSQLIHTAGLFGLELGGYLWRGSGLFTQSLAMHLLALSLGLAARALRSGRCLTLSGFGVGLTFLAHFIYGYIAGVSIALLATLEAPRRQRLARLVWIGAIALVTAAPVLMPLLLDAPEINRSRWEPSWKWDSFGAAGVLSKLVRGELLDAGRFPSLSLLALAGALWVVGSLFRRSVGGLDPAERSASRFALAGAVLWLLLFFGRPFWGGALGFVGLSELTHLHRLIGGLHFFLILLAALGLRGLWPALAELGRRQLGTWLGRVLASAGVFAILWPALAERSQFLERNRTWGQENAAAHRVERAQLETVLTLAEDAPGRVFAGLGGGWGKDFRVGSVPLSAWLSRERVPALSYLYHSMAPSGDLMVHFNEWLPEHYGLFNVSTVLAPADRQVAAFLEPAGRSGRFRAWRAPESGYFDLVAVDHAVVVDRSSFYDVNKRWLDSPWPGQRRHLRLDWAAEPVPSERRLALLDAGVPLPALAEQAVGSVDWQERRGAAYRAHVDVRAPAYLLFKMTFHRNWRATVDGESRPVVRLSPGLIGVPLEPGGYEVEFRYRPEAWRGPSLAVCLALLLLAGWVEPRGRVQELVGRPATESRGSRS